MKKKIISLISLIIVGSEFNIFLKDLKTSEKANDKANSNIQQEKSKR